MAKQYGQLKIGAGGRIAVMPCHGLIINSLYFAIRTLTRFAGGETPSIVYQYEAVAHCKVCGH